MYDSPTDVVSVFVESIENGKNLYMLSLDPTTEDFWIPSAKVVDKCWKTTCDEILRKIFGDTNNKNEPEFFKLYKIWQPDPFPSIFHVVYKLHVSQAIKESSNIDCQTKKWVTSEELMKLVQSCELKGPEILHFVGESNTEHKVKTKLQEYCKLLHNNMFKSVNEMQEKHFIEGETSNLVTQVNLLHMAGFFKPQQRIIYRTFTALCFPTMFMSKKCFFKFGLNFNWLKSRLDDLFRAADLDNKNFVTFHEFLCLLAAMEPATPHGEDAAAVRTQYIFRYYDRNQDSILETTEFEELIYDIRLNRCLPLNIEVLKKEVESNYKNMGIEPFSKIHLNQFMLAVSNLKLRGTSVLFRSPGSILDHLKKFPDLSKIMEISTIMENGLPENLTSNKVLMIPKTKNTNDLKEFVLANHKVKVQKSGQLVNVEKLFAESGDIINSSSDLLVTHYRNLQSVDAFDMNSLPNQMITGLHYFARAIEGIAGSCNIKEEYSWGEVDMQGFANCLIGLCEQVKPILSNEQRVLQVMSPVWVLGDIHGNFKDLICFEDTLWRLGLKLSPSSVLLLGDYVDRGPFGIEVCSYLFASKVQNPDKIFLLRGNHETREMQKMHTFYTECMQRFGTTLGEEVWNSVNSAFDVMPLTAVIDHKVFCCHGGIPPFSICPNIDIINSIPCPLKEVMKESQLAWEIMWNDPVRTVTQEINEELLANNGFAENRRRGTAHVFSKEALEHFLCVNNLSHVIRAHEVQETGFEIQQNGRLFTVFSSSNYAGGKNEAACILAHHHKLRIFSIDTS